MQSPELTAFSEGANTQPPMRFGTRYDNDRFLPECGNTVVCNLDTTDPAHQAVLRARERLRALPGADRLLFTPVESLHMTLFEGALDTRRIENAWPKDMDLAKPMDEVTQDLLMRLTEFTPLAPFKVKPAGLRPAGLILEGATEQDEYIMRAWRNALCAPFGYRHDSHDDYRFHMTFAYPLDWLPDALLPEWHTGFDAILAELVKAAPVMPLRPPAFCRFADMTRFEELLILRA